MYELMKELDDLSDERKLDIMNDYTGFFAEQADIGRTEEEIISLLHSPKEIAESYRNGEPVELESFGAKSEERQPAHKRVLKFILLIPCAVIYVPFTAVIGAALVLLSVALCAATVALSVFAFSAVKLSIGFVLIGAGGIIFTASFVMLCVAFVRLTGKMVLYLPKYMAGVLKDRSVTDI